MTERERIREDDVVHRRVEVYDTPTYDVEAMETAPKDRVRWGPIVAGLFAALSTLIILGLLGLAVGLSSYDANDPARSFGIGAGIWGAISALIAFVVGGWLAARTAAVRGTSNGVLNGAMVWVVTIPLLLYLLGSGIGSLLSTASSVAATGAEVAGEAAANNPALQATAQAGAPGVGQAAQATAQALGDQVTPGNVEQAAESAAPAAWGTIVSLLIGLAAAALGGYMGSRPVAVARTAVGTR